ncbi:response regulator transcription factor [Burkholderia sp. 22PA0106]|uniref:response regulator transcription factor n=1 Tax=Burkholderia sp. 22PA0106 TaxID=3237371 RepID=UPI0039C0364C
MTLFRRSRSRRARSGAGPWKFLLPTGERMRILVVEDDPVQAEAVSNVLSRHRHAVSIVENGEKAVRMLRSEPVDAVVLDWHLPRMSGIEVLNWIRDRIGAKYGVLFLTSRIHEVDIVRALEAGADDYLVKPFRADELAARVNALLRRVKRFPALDGLVRAGKYVLDPQERTIALNGEAIELTMTELKLVETLFDNIGTIMPRDLLATTAWGRALGRESRSLDTHIYRIRQKLKLCPENGLRLTSVYTVGYRLDVVKPAELSPA